MSWEDIYLDLAATYEHVLALRAKSYGGDPTRPAVGVARGFMGVGVEELEEDVTSKLFVLPCSMIPHLASRPRTTPSSLKIRHLYQAQLVLTH